MKRAKLMKTVLSTALAAGMVCGSMNVAFAEGITEDDVTLTFYTWWADAEQTMGDALIEQFESEYPNIHIDVNYIAESDYLSKINTLLAADSMPDVFYLNEYLVTDWGTTGNTLDLNPLFDQIGVNADDTWVDTALYKNEDALYGINYGSTTCVLYYNKDMLAEAGIEAPSSDGTKAWTWDEYVDAAIKMTKDVNGNTPADEDFDYDSCMQFGTTMTSSWIYWLPVLYAGGTAIADDAGETLKITSPEAISAIQSIADLSGVHKCAPTSGATESVFSDASAMLMNGQLGMFIGGNFLQGNFDSEKYDVGITQIPTQNGADPCTMVWSAAFAASAKTEHPAEAALFISWMANFDNTVKVAADKGVAINTLPNSKATLDETTELHATWKELYNETMASISSGILTSASRKGENVTLKNFSVLMNEALVPALDEVWIGDKTAEEALTGIEDKLNSDLQGAW